MRLITWNIQCGCEPGEGFTNGWPRRKNAVRAELNAERFDILCVQEALPSQLKFLSDALPEFSCASFARDSSAGEHCAIFFNRSHIECSDCGRFWLSDTPDRPGPCWDLHYRRICMWVRLRERGGEPFHVFNTHFPLLSSGRKKAARLVLARINDIGGPALLCGDFNCSPRNAAWQFFEEHGLRNTGGEAHTPTFRRFGVERCLDAIFARGDWLLRGHRVIDPPAKRNCSSDHRAIIVDLQRGNAAQRVVGGKSHAASGPGSVRFYF